MPFFGHGLVLALAASLGFSSSSSSFSFAALASAAGEPSSSSRFLVTPYTFNLSIHHSHPLPPSSKHLRKRNHDRDSLRKRQFPDPLPSLGPAPSSSSSTDADLPTDLPPLPSGSPQADPDPVTVPLTTLAGRVYMTNITLSSSFDPYTLVIDTGSSDTWIAASTFQCNSKGSDAHPLPQAACGFGKLYDPSSSSTFQLESMQSLGREGGEAVSEPQSLLPFRVKYTDGESLYGILGSDILGIGDVTSDDLADEAGQILRRRQLQPDLDDTTDSTDTDEYDQQDGSSNDTVIRSARGLSVRQTIGVVEQGWWVGDGKSSGLMGLAYPVLASGQVGNGALSGVSSMFGLGPSKPQSLNYTSVVFSLFRQHDVPSVFSLALSRPTKSSPEAGGILAIGGIPRDISYQEPFVYVPIQPVVQSTYAFYSIPVQGYNVIMPQAGGAGPKGRTRREEQVQLGQKFDARGTVVETQDLGAPGSPANGQQNTTSQARQYSADSTTVEMIIDSGSTLMYLPDPVADYIASLFSPPATYDPAADMYSVDCGAQKPSVGVVIQGTTFWIDGQDLVDSGGSDPLSGGDDDDEDIPAFNPDAFWGLDYGAGLGKRGEKAGREGRRRRRQTGDRSGNGSACAVTIQPQGHGDAVLGDAFLRNVVAVFDVGENEMGFAARGAY